MENEPDVAQTDDTKRILTPAAERALKEADERRASRATAMAEAAQEIGGRGGLDPARFGDWEVNGRAIDF